MQLAAQVRHHELRPVVFQIEIVDLHVEPGDRIVLDFDRATRAARGLERAEIRGRQCDLQEAGVGGRKLHARDVRARMRDEGRAAQSQAGLCVRGEKIALLDVDVRPAPAFSPSDMSARHDFQRVGAEVQQHRAGQGLSGGAVELRLDIEAARPLARVGAHASATFSATTVPASFVKSRPPVRASRRTRIAPAAR